MCKTVKVLVFSVVCTALLACSNPAMVPVPLEQRTESVLFDGEWLGNIAMDNKYQRHGRYEFTCPAWSADLSLTAKKGLVTGKIVYEDGAIQVFTANINDHGYFLAMVESNDQYNVDTGASRRIQYALRMKLLLTTKQGKGEFVLSNGANGQGCTARVTAELKG